jgi:hypothetical protein
MRAGWLGDRPPRGQPRHGYFQARPGIRLDRGAHTVGTRVRNAACGLSESAVGLQLLDCQSDRGKLNGARAARGRLGGPAAELLS